MSDVIDVLLSDKHGRPVLWVHPEYGVGSDGDAGRNLVAAAQELTRLRQQLADAKEQANRDYNAWRLIHQEQLDRIGAALDPIRKKRSTGEPARSDAEEIESLAAQLADEKAGRERAEGVVEIQGTVELMNTFDRVQDVSAGSTYIELWGKTYQINIKPTRAAAESAAALHKEKQ